MSRLVALLDVLLGFFALAVFAYLAFGKGRGTDAQLLLAFKLASPLAAAELALLLLLRARPVNRLILGANLWLMAGGLAAALEQWWWLQAYQRLGEASLFLAMLVVGAIATVATSAGFVAAPGPPRAVLRASLLLLAGVSLALAAAFHFRGQVQFAAVLPVMALSWLNRLLRHALPRLA